jgi:hypothetical protein
MGDDPRIGKGIHVAGSRGKRGVGLYGKSDNYLICSEKLVRSCGGTSIFSLSKSQVGRP